MTILPTTIKLSCNPIIVVSAAIVDAESKRLFVQRRSGKTSYPWHWCTPRGKTKERESLWYALCRELYEEHGIHVCNTPGTWMYAEPVYIHDLPPTLAGQIVRVYCQFIPKTAIIGPYSANAEAVAGFDWVTADELETLTLTPADDANRGALLSLLR